MLRDMYVAQAAKSRLIRKKTTTRRHMAGKAGGAVE
jgi:hypothetical protein